MTQAGSMRGKTCVVTGANSGIGKETALGLARLGAQVVMVCRNREKGQVALEDIRRESGSSQVDLLIADLSSQASVRELAKQICAKYQRLDVLINNAGATSPARKLSADGIEVTVAGNHLGPALLTALLLGLLKSSAPSRIINVSSEGHRAGRMSYSASDLQYERRKYSWGSAYAQSKLLMNAYTFELARRLEGTGVTANCLHPGLVTTNLGGSDQSLGWKIIFGLLRPLSLNAQQGARTTLYVASDSELAGVSGKYFAKSKIAPSSPQSRDPKLIAEVWRWTEKMTGQPLA
jgi:NAD(P)-dependent dehydrogenase (short-subunit alcohol dehydrogenase family)